MHEYIKVVYQGFTYGPIEAPTTFSSICQLLRVSLRAKPILKNMTNEDYLVSLPDTDIKSGLYELLANPNIQFDESIDGLPEKQALKVWKPPKGKEVCTQTTGPIQSNVFEQGPMFPLKKDEMQEVTNGMLHLLATVPPRYIKYNKLLSQQIDEALQQANEWSEKLNGLYEKLENATGNTKHTSGVSLGTFMTFIQYRILNMLHDIWKRVWQRFAPANRVYSVSKIYTLHSLQTVEHILNCLSSWRRMIEREEWSRIKQHVQATGPSHNKNRVLMPPRLASDEHAGDMIQLSQQRPIIQPIRNQKRDLDHFRTEFVKRVSLEEVYKNEDMVRILNALLREKEASEENTTETGAYPSKFIKQSIRHEFQINC